MGRSSLAFRGIVMSLLLLSTLAIRSSIPAPPPLPTLPLLPMVDRGAITDTTLASQWSTTPALAREIRLASAAHSIPLSLAFALVHAESRFTPTARSHAGAIGLTQVMPATGAAHCALSPTELLKPRLNLDCGFSYLAMLYSRLGDWRLALIAYNRGPGKLAYERSRGLSHGTSERYARSILSQLTS